MSHFLIKIWDKVFKNRPSKGRLPQTLLGPFLNTFLQMTKCLIPLFGTFNFCCHFDVFQTTNNTVTKKAIATIEGTIMQIEKALINYRLRVSKVS